MKSPPKTLWKTSWKIVCKFSVDSGALETWNMFPAPRKTARTKKRESNFPMRRFAVSMWTPMTKMGLARSCNQKVDRCSNLAVLKLQLGLESGGTFAAVWVQFLFHATMLQHLQTTVCTASICSVAFRKLFEPALADPNNLQALLTFLIHCTCPLCQWQSICWTMLNLRFGVICSSCFHISKCTLVQLSARQAGLNGMELLVEGRQWLKAAHMVGICLYKG